MTPQRRKYLQDIHGYLYRAKEFGSTEELIGAIRLMLVDASFKVFLKEASAEGKISPHVSGWDDMQTIAKAFLNRLFWNQEYEEAACLLWSSEMFTAEPRSVQMIWDAIRKNRLINILGSASAGKTFSAACYLLLDWVTDPEWTLVRMVSTKEDHLLKNLFADVQRLYEQSAIQLPGTADTRSIATERGRKAGFGIFAITIPLGEASKGTIKGSKVKPRPFHPLFGYSSRTRLLLDEAQEIAVNAFTEIPNLFSSIEEGDIEHTKIITAANPSNIASSYGRNCVPIQGWEGIQTRDSVTDTWTSETGWFCVRLNGLKSENIVQKKTIFPRFMTWNGYQMKLKAYGGDGDHPMIWSEVYGMFPPKGSATAIIQKHHVDRSYGEWIFKTGSVGYLGADPAFTGDNPAVASGRVGEAIAWTDFRGTRHDLAEPRWAIQLDVVGMLNRGDTQDLVDQLLARAKLLGVQPEGLCMDSNGNGQGVLDGCQRQWNVKVRGVQEKSKEASQSVAILGVKNQEKATEIRICEEDTKSPYELYDGVKSETYYAAAKYFEYDYIRIGKGVDHRTIEQLVTRRGSPLKGKMCIESKDDFKARGFTSPDEADAVVLLIHRARLGTPQMKPKSQETVAAQPEPQRPFVDPSMQGLMFVEACDMGFGAPALGFDVFKD